MGETEYMYSVMASITLPFMPWSSGADNIARSRSLRRTYSGTSLERKSMLGDMLRAIKWCTKKLEGKKDR